MATASLILGIVALIPCVSPCCSIGLLFGVWGLVVLLKGDVKSCFT